MLPLILQITRGLIRDSRARRAMMFYTMLIALLLLFSGSVLFDAWLREHPLMFLGFWAACVWFTAIAVLLAIFDMLIVRAMARRTRRELERQYLDPTKAKPDEDTR